MQRIRTTGAAGDAYIPSRAPVYAPGERRKQADGYVRVKPPGYLKPTLEHRYVVEALLGRRLLRQETVHHINGIRDDNRPENLELWVSCHNSGQRVEDLVDWILRTYPEYVEAALAGQAQLRLAG